MRPAVMGEGQKGAIYEAGGRGVKRGLGFELRLAVFVITGLVPVIYVLPCFLRDKTWMAGSSPAMTANTARRLEDQKTRPAKPDAFFFVRTLGLERFRCQSSNLNETLSLAR
jgi:hypothetical protein